MTIFRALKHGFFAALFLQFAAVGAYAQSTPGLTYGQVPTAGQWNSYFAAKQDTLGYTPVNRAGDTMSGKLRTVAPTVSAAGFSLLPGITPTTPIDGDMWVTSSGLYARINGTTVGPISSTTGTVTSVGISVPAYMAVTNSPVTSTGTMGLSFAPQSQNLVFASPAGSSGIPTFRSLVGADLPNPSASTLGGIRSAAAVSNQWINSISTSGVPSLSQPAFSNLSGAVSSGQIPSNVVTNAMLAQVNTATFKGRTTASTGNVEDLTATQATALLNNVVGDSGSGGTKGLVPAPASGDAASGKYLNANGNWATPPVSQTLPGYLYGLGLANNATDAVNDIDIATGAAADDGATPVLMTLASAMTKRLDATWSVGTNQGGLDTGAKANNTGYHIYLIQRSDTGVTDICFSTSSSGPATGGANPIPAAYDRKVKIGAIITDGSGAIRGFVQSGNRFVLTSSFVVINLTGASGGNITNNTLPLPTGLRYDVEVAGSVTSTSAWAFFLYTPGVTPDVQDLVARGSVAAVSAIGIGRVLSNTSSQITTAGSISSMTITLALRAWTYPRGG